METQENSQESSENQLKLDETDNPSNTTLGNLSVKYQNYYQQLIELTKNNVKPLRLISLKEIASEAIFSSINEAGNILQKYRDGNFDPAETEQDILKLLSINFVIAQYSGLLKAGAKNNIAVKKNEYNQNLISIKERNYSDRVVNASIPKLSIDELKSLAEMSTMELGKQMYEYDIYANIFEHVYNLIIHSTTIMNSILKRDHANDGNRQFGPAGF